MVELKAAADALRRLPRCGEPPSRELDRPARRADDEVARVVVGHPDPQPRQERGHVLARQHGRVLAAVLARVEIVGQVAQPHQVAVRGLGLPAREPLDRVSLRGLPQPPLVQMREVQLALVLNAEHAEVPHVPLALLLGRRTPPPRGRLRGLDRPARLIGGRHLGELED